MTKKFDVICFSHLRWDFVYQRPQHLMSRFARDGRVFFIEEPVRDTGQQTMEVLERAGNVFVCKPHVEDDAPMPDLIAGICRERSIDNYIAWFYTPMMLDWARDLTPQAVVYDCMDQLSAFRGAPPELLDREKELFAKADLVFTGGQSLYEAKRDQHPHVFAFPSSIDAAHLGKARSITSDVEEQAAIAHPRVGFAGVIDERSDLELLTAIADLRPEWSFIMVGPVVKIDESDLPRRANIYYLGQKTYDDIPAVLAGWDAAMMPFALNESTRYISPTKTPEYLAAGLPVVSTPIADVVRPYGEKGLVYIASTPSEFVEALEKTLAEDGSSLQTKADEFLQGSSWNKTYYTMRGLIEQAVDKRAQTQTAAAPSTCNDAFAGLEFEAQAAS
jgi:UDP-galactopyranose mutase